MIIHLELMNIRPPRSLYEYCMRSSVSSISGVERQAIQVLFGSVLSTGHNVGLLVPSSVGDATFLQYLDTPAV